DVEVERRVIAEERARELSAPLGRLDQTHLAVTYLRHPYRNPILGWPDDIERIGPDDLRTFYETHYRPDGAVLVVVGDVDADAAWDQLPSLFAGAQGAAHRPPKPESREPIQVGRRAFVVADSESSARGLLGWRTVSRDHADAPALDLLAD